MASKFTPAMLLRAMQSADNVNLRGNIEIAEDVYLPPGKEINPVNSRFIYKGGTLHCRSTINAGRRRIFDGFPPGAVRYADIVLPEWWGLEGDGHNDGRHDLAINCAARAGMTPDTGVVVSLAARQYWVSAPLDFRGTNSRLLGQGSGQTFVLATTRWSPPEWEDCSLFGHWTNQQYALDSLMESGPKCASALAWIGSKALGGGRSFCYGIDGVSFSGWYAVRAHPTKRISGIAGTGWVEENSILRDIAISQFSGMGVGVSHPGSIGTTNGMTLQNFWISKATRRGAIPIYVGNHAGVHSIRDGTIDCRIEESETTGEYQLTWPMIGIMAGGAHTVLDSLHIEGCGTGIHIINDYAGSVGVSNVDVTHMMCSSMRFYNDFINRAPGPPPHRSALFTHSCAVSIGRRPEADTQLNITTMASVTGVHALGQCKYLLCDPQCNKYTTTIGQGRDPNEESASLPPHHRNIPFAPAEGAWPMLKRRWREPHEFS